MSRAPESKLRADPACTAVMTADWLPGYELLSVVGTGGFSTVYRARQLRLDRVVAIKVLQADDFDAAMAARFEAEAQTHGKLHHPNIVEVYDSGRHGDRMFIAMELLEGEDLGRRIQREGPLPEPVAWAIARQAAAALAYAAASGLVHRDIKPANLFLCPAPSWIGLEADVPLVKVTDFGLALARCANRAETQPSKGGILLGTPLYMAPEQHRQPEDLDHRADIFALGATIVHATTGRPPFDGARVCELLEQKLGTGLKFAPSLSRESAQLLESMTAPTPEDRPATYEDLIARIDRLPATATNRWKRLYRSRRTRRLAAATVIAAVAFGGCLWIGQRSIHATQPPVRYVSTAEHLVLFDGASINGWIPPATGGIWQLDHDEEAEPVLVGTDYTRRAFASMESYRVTLGLDIFKSTSTEVHFAIPAVNPESGTRFVLRISRSSGALFGVGNGNEFQPRSEAVPFPPLTWFEGRRPYLEVRIERAGPTWTASFNGRLVGTAKDDGQPKTAEVRVRAVEGPARINSAILTELRPE